MEIFESAPGALKNSAHLGQVIDDAWGPKTHQPNGDGSAVIPAGQHDPSKDSNQGQRDGGPPDRTPPPLEPQRRWSPFPADASPDLVQAAMERTAGDLAAQISQDHFADPTQQKVAEFMGRFAENPGAAIDMINEKLAKDGLYLDYQDDPEALSKEYSGKMLKDGTFQNEIVGAVTLYDVRTNTKFPDPLILLGARKKSYDI